MSKFEQISTLNKAEKSQESQEKKESFFRNQRNKIGLVLLSLGITIAGWGCERRPEKIFNEIKKQTGQYTELVSKTEQENGYVTTIWENPNTKKRRQVSGYYSDGDYIFGLYDIPSEKEQKAVEEEKLAKEQELALEQQRQEQERKEIKEKAKEHLDEAKNLMYPYEYQEAEMQELMNTSKEIYEFAGEATPDEIKEFLQEGEQWPEKDLVDIAQRIDEETVLKLAEQIARSPRKIYQEWKTGKEIPNLLEKLENVIKYTLPKGWVDYSYNNGVKIIYDARTDYGNIIGGEQNANEIFIYDPFLPLDHPDHEFANKLFIGTLIHEFIHATGSSYQGADNFSLGKAIILERAKLNFFKRHGRLNDKLWTDDSEKIKKILEGQAEEVLTHGLGSYLSNPDSHRYPEESNFFANYLKEMDPDFDARKAADLRKKILEGWRVKEAPGGAVFLLPPEIQ